MAEKSHDLGQESRNNSTLKLHWDRSLSLVAQTAAARVVRMDEVLGPR